MLQVLAYVCLYFQLLLLTWRDRYVLLNITCLLSTTPNKNIVFTIRSYHTLLWLVSSWASRLVWKIFEILNLIWDVPDSENNSKHTIKIIAFRAIRANRTNSVLDKPCTRSTKTFPWKFYTSINPFKPAEKFPRKCEKLEIHRYLTTSDIWTSS